MCRIFDNDFNELAVNENIPLLAYSPLAKEFVNRKIYEYLMKFQRVLGYQEMIK